MVDEISGNNSGEEEDVFFIFNKLFGYDKVLRKAEEIDGKDDEKLNEWHLEYLKYLEMEEKLEKKIMKNEEKGKDNEKNKQDSDDEMEDIDIEMEDIDIEPEMIEKYKNKYVL